MPSNAVIAGMLIVLSTASASVDAAIEDAIPVTQTVTKSPKKKPRTQQPQTIYETVAPDDEWEYVDEGGEEINEETPMEPGSIPGVSLEEERRFDQLAQCESGGDWHINTGNGYRGGLQMLQSTFLAYGGDEFGPYPDLLTREEQIQIAKRIKDGQGWGAWPSCSRKYGYI